MEWLTLILILFLGALGIHYILLQKLNHLEKLGILHIKPLPFFGNMAPAFFGRRALCEVLDKAYKLNEEALYTGLYDFGVPVILIKAPELIRSITVKNFDHFVDRRSFVDAEMDPLFGKTLFSLCGNEWKNMRHLLSPSFTGSKMKYMFNVVSNCAKSFSQYLNERSMNEPHVLDMKDALTRYTNDVIASCAFGITIDSMRDPKNEFFTMGKEGANLEGSLSVRLFLLRNFPTIVKFFDIKITRPRTENFFTGIVKETIETRERYNITRPDMIQLMMTARGKTGANRPKLSVINMAAQAFNFFFGGFDTTSTLMSFLAHSIAVNEDIQKRLQDEVDEVLEKTNGDPTYEAVNGMQFLDAVIRETLRLYPVLIILDRVCVKPFELPPALPEGKPITIERGQNIWLPIYSMHRDPKYFQNPDEFDPDRFMGIRKDDIDPYTFFPFGHGPRKCIAHKFVFLQTKVLFFHLLSMFHLKASPKTIVPLEIGKSNIVLTAEGGFWLQLESRTRGVKSSKVVEDYNNNIAH